MKKTGLTLTILLIPFLGICQRWLDLGIKGGYGLNLLYNQNYLNDASFTPLLSQGYMYGGKIGFNFNEEHSLTFDFTSSLFNQEFNYSLLNSDSSRTEYSRKINFNSLNFLLMYRKQKASGYVEVGPQYSIITKGTMSDSRSGKENIIPYLNKASYAAVLGFGGFLMGSENVGLTLGLRLSYTVNDILSKEGRAVNFPAFTNYASYRPANPFTALLVMEFNYDLGYLVSSRCGKKTKFLMF